MHARTATASLLVAAALALAPVTAAAAASSGDTHPGAAKAAAAKARATAHRLEHAANTHRSFVLGGKVTATVAATDTAPGTVTFTLHGSRFRALRGTPVTVDVTATTKVTRNGPATLADVLVGDHVVVRAHRLDVSLVKDANGRWTFTGEAVALRLAASPTADSVPPAPPAPVDPVTPPVPAT